MKDVFQASSAAKLINILKRPKGLRRVVRNMYLDLRFGRKCLGCMIPSKHLAENALHVENTDYGVFNHFFSSLKLEADEVIVDVGCGKGRLFNFLLHKKYPNKMFGIELVPEVAEFTKSRLRKFSQIEVVKGNVFDLDRIPGTFFYLYNPFTLEGFQLFVEKLNLELTLYPRERSVRLLYRNAFARACFVESGKWKEIQYFTPEASEASSGGVLMEWIG